MSKGWYTKKDILDDLAEATGKRIARFDDRFAVSGERPPPVHVPDEENDEYLLMFGEYASQNSKNVEPDLCGIKHMLRMVNDYYDTATFDDDENIKELKKTANTIITISKLNPDVPEFVPRNIEKSKVKETIMNNVVSKIPEPSDSLRIKESNSKDVGDKDLDCNNYDVENKTESSHINETNNNDIDVTKKIDVASLNSKDIKDISEKLKLKIVGPSKADCLNKKRERNLAMASLLKLYTSIPKSPKQSDPIKLMTPEYFKTGHEVSKDEDVETCKGVTEQNTAMSEVINDTDDKNSQDSPSTTNPVLVPTSSLENIVSASSKHTEVNLEKPNDSLMSNDIQESVKKVDKWLNGPEKKKEKSSAIYFGPVTFKKKGTTSVTSSESPTLPNIEPSLAVPERQSNTHTSFVPSSYANQLNQSYMERCQSKGSHQREDIWTSLERKLKEKDEAIKQGLVSPKSKK